METGEKLLYEPSNVTLQEYEAELDRLWSELKDPDSDLRQEAKLRGIDVEPLLQLERKEAIAIAPPDEAGFSAQTVTVIVALAPVATAVVKAAAPIIKDLWTKVLRPRIIQKKGASALRPK